MSNTVAAPRCEIVTEADGYDHATIFAGDQRLHVVVKGSGPLVLLVHGFPESWFCWREQIDAIAARGYRVAAPDMRGYGRSGKPAAVEDYSILKLVDDCVAIVTALGAEEATIVGHDWGSMVAWTAAWTRPEVFTAVIGMSVAFGGRGLIPIAGVDSFGTRRPSEVQREIAGPDKVFYQEYWVQKGALESEFEADPRGFLRDQYYSFSAGPFPPDYQAPNPLEADPAEVAEQTRSGGACLDPGAKMRDGLLTPDPVPDWLAADLDEYVAEFERTGLEAPLNWYRAMDLSWEELEPYADRPIEVPALFIGADLDVATQWSVEAVAAFDRTVPKHRPSVILQNCGHWFTRERPAETTAAILEFLEGLGHGR
ncbi:alpha/beta fold hydrolase [Mycolicibacterium thermoresistibile]|uniref:Putative hydrolase or acyltransferase of alpha/beta superfamily protein n=2 Tax=Mycolicibacterium thermoresistibile TaxID=1797 RepID=G7CJ98_MYCT3|nr:alpha/beta hydrolase [Mycolicibacterium thermoresistibile]EHI12696.1 putative hydrolase or acyltransferase of alpha/beta superfamily protein [Mycolicibacterium thermoresistibile ATCC 19527]MCV7190043.1 alpha/beta hydrolase [Mycolicibacterium thermoresistibile]GAT13900.1 putative hydrolase or acyltransferase of alpha/b eta superfamily protein [Mycolicibacterium thermoresistibile]SNW19073.1 alpha/beta hydrolase fold protein [Mycolicibacterium thermoresistibile]